MFMQGKHNYYGVANIQLELIQRNNQAGVAQRIMDSTTVKQSCDQKTLEQLDVRIRLPHDEVLGWHFTALRFAR